MTTRETSSTAEYAIDFLFTRSPSEFLALQRADGAACAPLRGRRVGGPCYPGAPDGGRRASASLALLPDVLLSV